jgi:hypothetical protein
MSDPSKRDIKDVLREERARGRQPLNTDQEARRRQFVRDFESLLREGDRKKFESFLIAHERLNETEEFPQAMSRVFIGFSNVPYGPF